MTAAAEINLRAEPDRTAITATRGDAVPDAFWSRLTAEWGTSGQRGRSEIAVPVELFLARLAWVRTACIQYAVGVDLDVATRDLVAEAGAQRSDLATAMTTPGATEDVAKRLQGGRFTRDLREFQLRNLGRLMALPNGANFSVPGAGKTSVTYALYEAERLRGHVSQMLVVAPLSAYSAWFDEVGECFAGAKPVLQVFDGGPVRDKTEILLVNYQRLISAPSYKVISNWVSSRRTHVILDEAHRIKRGRTGEWGRAALSLAYLAARRDILSGTPAPQGFKDLEALFDFTWPGQARMILPEDLFLRGRAETAGSKVAAAISPLFVRTTKADLGLPRIDFEVVPIPLQGLQREIYTALRNDYAGELRVSRREQYDFARMGQVVMYLLEAASNPQLLAAGSSEFDAPEFRHPPVSIMSDSRLPDLLNRYAQYETPPKFVALGEIIKVNAEQGRRTLVWTNFVKNISSLKRMLARYNPAVVHGGVPSGDGGGGVTREQEIARFRDATSGCMVLIANPAAMSEGISLHRECLDAVYLERTFNAGQYLQSLDRIHRLGLTKDQTPRVTFLQTVDTIDYTVEQRIKDKAKRLGHILDDPAVAEMALPDEDDYGPPFDGVADLAALLDHLRGGG